MRASATSYLNGVTADLRASHMEDRADFAHLFIAATGKSPFPYQIALAEGAELPELLRAPTGAGKTAAAVLGWLFRRRYHSDRSVRRATPRRLVYSLPMRALVEQTVDAVRGWVRALDLADEVGVFQLMGGAVQDDWVRTPDRDAVLVGTMDMLLSRALNRGYAASRFRWPIEFGLLNNDCLWVLDEVQLMGNGLAASAQLAGLRRALGTVLPCPSLFMSATVAREWLGTVDHEAPRSEATIGEADRAAALGERLRARKRLERLPVDDWPRAGPAAVAALHRPGTLTLVVVNTVQRALDLARRVQQGADDDVDVLVAHSRFRPPDRREISHRLASRVPESGRIVVATQVVEAGVDLSAATLISEIAPWGSMVQRFGRCNRFGELAEARVAWVDLTPRDAAPYAPEDLEEARERLRDLDGGSVGPDDLERLGPGRRPEATHVLRRVDVIDLFDTEPDLGGNDVDVSRFIRDDADVDVQVLWRRWEGPGPGAGEPRPSAEELCPVPVGEVRAFLGAANGRRVGAGHVWDHLEGKWRPVAPEEVRPGMALLLPSDAGGYAAAVGWDRTLVEPVQPVHSAVAHEDEEGMGDDPPEEVTGAWVPLPDHLGHVRGRLEALLDELHPDLADWEREALLAAALWHDVGKAHRQFQEALLRNAPGAEGERAAGTLWAKAPFRPAPYGRRYFRHELASALALLGAPPAVHGLSGRALDLAVYLTAAHHGKVRLAIRSLEGERRPDEPGRRFARGVWDGETIGPVPLDGALLPEIALDLSVMEVGRGPGGRPSWVERALAVRDALGPFRLGFLEAVLRVADWEASAEEAREARGG